MRIWLGGTHNFWVVDRTGRPALSTCARYSCKLLAWAISCNLHWHWVTQLPGVQLGFELLMTYQLCIHKHERRVRASDRPRSAKRNLFAFLGSCDLGIYWPGR
jgi:hypothetical protein